MLPIHASFNLDTEDTFNGIHFGQFWNGFAQPMFTKEEGMRVMEYVNIANNGEGTVSFDEQTDQFIEHYEGDFEQGTPKLIDGVKYYPLGNGWIWMLND